MKKKGNESGNVGILEKVNRLDLWPVHLLDEIRVQQGRYLAIMERWMLGANFECELEFESLNGTRKPTFDCSPL
jgi:hypothetical protein